MKIFASNFRDRLITETVVEKNAKLGQRGSERGDVTYFLNFEIPPYLQNGGS